MEHILVYSYKEKGTADMGHVLYYTRPSTGMIKTMMTMRKVAYETEESSLFWANVAQFHGADQALCYCLTLNFLV